MQTGHFFLPQVLKALVVCKGSKDLLARRVPEVISARRAGKVSKVSVAR